MKIAFTSDLHLDYGSKNCTLFDKMISYVETIAPDYFLVAGDISGEWSSFCRGADALRSLVETGCRVCAVLGNHDIWVFGRRPESASTSWDKLSACTDALRTRGIVPLDADGPLIDADHDLAIVGTVGWYDYSLRSAYINISLEEYAKKTYGGVMWMDALYARWGVDDPVVCKRFAGALSRQLAAVKKVGRVVAVTHHVPFRAGVIEKGEPEWDFCNAFMGATTLGDILLEHCNVQRVVFGHSHIRRRFAEGSLICESSPIGYLDVPVELGEENIGEPLDEVATRKVVAFSL